MEIVPGLHLLAAGEYGIGHLCDCNVFAIEYETGTVLVDAGSGLGSAQLVRAFETLPPITHVLITHAHWDHARGVRDVVDATGATVVGHSGCNVELGGNRWSTIPASRLGAPTPAPVLIDEPVDATFSLELPGLTIRAIPTPGHTPESVCYLIEGRAGSFLATGDTVVGGGSVGAVTTATDLDALDRSLDELVQTGCDGLLPGHRVFSLAGGLAQLRGARDRLRAEPPEVVTAAIPYWPAWWLEQHPELARGI